jgi:DNA-directed RNA polymerase subunit RPC12/RpoP
MVDYNSYGKHECSICGRLRSDHHFTQEMLDKSDGVECNACVADVTRNANCKCMKCGKRFRSNNGNKFGICYECKRTYEYQTYDSDYAIGT